MHHLLPEPPEPGTVGCRRLALQRLMGALAWCAAWPAAALASDPRPQPRPPACRAWPLWQGFLDKFAQADGRVIDDQFQTRYTTSEGQAYALFFCLVNDDRPRFDTLLRWTETHLAGGSLQARLPGWRWGRDDRGEWRLIDSNPASDADLWLAHTLFEAARLWQAPAYRDTAQALLRQVQDTAVVQLPGFGAMLLPAPAGFAQDGAWRLNPSYLPLHQLRAFTREDPQGPWAKLAGHTVSMLEAVTHPTGFAPDWVAYAPPRGWHATDTSPALGSYDAIRVYLWAGLVHPSDPLRPALLSAVRGMRNWLARGEAGPPQQVRTDSGQGQGLMPGPVGFSGALLPYLNATGRSALRARQAQRVATALRHGAPQPAPAGCSGGATAVASAWVGESPTYYDQVLCLFGVGAVEGRYRFTADGTLQRPTGVGSTWA